MMGVHGTDLKGRDRETARLDQLVGEYERAARALGELRRDLIR